MSENITNYDTQATPSNGGNGHGYAIVESESGELKSEPTALAIYDLPNRDFRAAMKKRDTNFREFITWINSSLTEKIDFYTLVIKGRETKPTLSKAGAEKICGILGVTVHFPNLQKYEDAMLSGVNIKQVVLRCEIRNNGKVIAEGVGARRLEQDYGDINKCLKMAAKSAHIDATLRCAGISSIFTQDLDDMSKSSYLTDIDVEELEHTIRKVCSQFKIDDYISDFRERILDWYCRFRNVKVTTLKDVTRDDYPLLQDKLYVFAQKFWCELPPTPEQQSELERYGYFEEGMTRSEAQKKLNEVRALKFPKTVDNRSHGEAEQAFEEQREQEHAQLPQAEIDERLRSQDKHNQPIY